jgi:formamidopyrimidine-DNA glycosylase
LPELPEVETVRRGLNRVTLLQIIEGGDVLLNRTIAHPLFIESFLMGLKGTMISEWHRRGKYLLAELITPNQVQPQSSAGWLGVHLRMTGQLLWISQDEPVQPHCRVRLFFSDHKELRFVDQRTFGQMWWVPPDVSPDSVILGLARLGPEPLSECFSPAYLKERFAHKHRPVKNALLDQAIIAGIGNIYADETLFLSQILPMRHCSTLTSREICRLHENIIRVLQDSIVEGGTSFSSFRDVQGVNGNYGNVAWVYGRESKPCRVCQTAIQRIKLAGRSSFFCPVCQH